MVEVIMHFLFFFVFLFLVVPFATAFGLLMRDPVYRQKIRRTWRGAHEAFGN